MKTFLWNLIFSKSTNSKIVPIFRQLYQIRVDHNREVAVELEDFFNKNHYHLSNVLRHVIYIVLRMHFAWEINNGNMSFAKSILNLHQIMVDNDYLIYNNQIATNAFINIVESASFLQKTEWGYQFVSNYKQFLEPQEKRNITNIAEAYLLFSE